MSSSTENLAAGPRRDPLADDYQSGRPKRTCRNIFASAHLRFTRWCSRSNAQDSSDGSRMSLAASKCSLIRNPCRSYFDPGFNPSKSPCSGTSRARSLSARRPQFSAGGPGVSTPPGTPAVVTPLAMVTRGAAHLHAACQRAAEPKWNSRLAESNRGAPQTAVVAETMDPNTFCRIAHDPNTSSQYPLLTRSGHSAPYSITPSASDCIELGTVRPSALASSY